MLTERVGVNPLGGNDLETLLEHGGTQVFVFPSVKLFDSHFAFHSTGPNDPNQINFRSGVAEVTEAATENPRHMNVSVHMIRRRENEMICVAEGGFLEQVVGPNDTLPHRLPTNSLDYGEDGDVIGGGDGSGFLFFGRFNANLPLRLRDTRLSREIWTRMGDSRFRVTGGLMVRARPLAPQFSAGDPCEILVTHVNLDINHGINLQGDVNGVEIMHIFSELDSH